MNLNESKNYPLYHTTTVFNALNILQSNSFEGSSKYDDNFKATERDNYICFTRNKTYIYDDKEDAYVRLSFSAEKLNQRYKIVPFNDPDYDDEFEERVYADSIKTYLSIS